MAQGIKPNEVLKARGTASRPAVRYDSLTSVPEPDGWDIPEEDVTLKTEVSCENARSIISRNTSPDVPFDRSINPYRGCEHGCVYCFARPSHAYLGMSPGLDFESKIIAKPNAAALLVKELSRKGYACAPMAIGTNTDPYQPLEAKMRIMRSILEVLLAWNHPVSIVTRGHTILRDLDILGAMAKRQQAAVGVSVTTLDAGLARKLEPRAPAPKVRLRMISELSHAGIPVRAMIAPVIPAVTDHELEALMRATREAGATRASMTPVRLPLEVAPLFRDWLERHMPDRAAHVMNQIQAMRGGRDNDPRFGTRMRGEGVQAQLLHRRFQLARKRLGFDTGAFGLDCSRFSPPPKETDQLSLF